MKTKTAIRIFYIKIECKILVFVSLIEYNQEQKNVDLKLIEWELVVFIKTANSFQ